MLMAAPVLSIRTARDHLPAVECRTRTHVTTIPRGMSKGRAASIQPSAMCPALETAAA